MRNRPMRWVGIGFETIIELDAVNIVIESSSRDRVLVGLPPIIPAPVLVKREISRGFSVFMLFLARHPVVWKVIIKEAVKQIPSPAQFFL